MFFVTAVPTLKAREGRYPGDDGETLADRPASAIGHGSGDRSCGADKISLGFFRVRRRSVALREPLGERRASGKTATGIASQQLRD